MFTILSLAFQHAYICKLTLNITADADGNGISFQIVGQTKKWKHFNFDPTILTLDEKSGLSKILFIGGHKSRLSIKR